MAQNTITYQLREDLGEIFINASSLDSQLPGIVFWAVAFQITDPTGNVVYENENFNNPVPSETLLTNSTIKSLSVPMTLDVSGKGVSGLWIFKAKILSDDIEKPTVELFTETQNIQFPSIEAVIEQTVDVDCSTLVSKDLTGYTYENVAPSITRTHKVTYPLNTNVAPIQNSQQIVSATPIYEGLFRTDVSTLCVFQWAPRFSSRILVAGFKTIKVIYQSLDDIQNKLFELNSRVEYMTAYGSPGKSIAIEKLNRCTGLIVLYEQAVKAGRQDLVSNYYNSLVAILGSNDVTTSSQG